MGVIDRLFGNKGGSLKRSFKNTLLNLSGCVGEKIMIKPKDC
mgnify:CR=1 FL=1